MKKNSLEWLRERANESEKKADTATSNNPQELFLPGCVDVGALPNHLNRSSLIAPIARGRRKFHQQSTLVSRSDCTIEYTGEQLDEADGDLIMALIFFAQNQKIGTFVPLNRKELLRKIKPGSLGSSQYEWLHKSMKRLRSGTLFIEARKSDGTTKYKIGSMSSFNILKELEYNEEHECYSFMLDPRWVLMFGNREYSLIDWNKRMQIGRGLDMAKTIQRMVATSSNAKQIYPLKNLKLQMEYAGRMRDFKESLLKAVREVERLEIVAKGAIEVSARGVENLVIHKLSLASLPGDAPPVHPYDEIPFGAVA